MLTSNYIASSKLHFFIRLFLASLPFRCFGLTTINGLLPRAPIIALMDNLPPTQLLTLVLDVLNCREIVLVLLHSSNPRHVVEGHDLEPEVLVVLDLLDGFEERVKVGSGLVVDVGEEVGWCEAYTY
jgi:hypothetical protein